jgi:MinD superfamily P-loop ATPase
LQIEKACQALGVEVIGLIPFDERVTQAMVLGEPVTSYRPDCAASVAIQSIWQNISARLLDQEQE